MEVLIMDQGTELASEVQTLCHHGILPLVCNLETQWQNALTERHGALFNMAFEKACSYESPTTDSELDELIDLTFCRT